MNNLNTYVVQKNRLLIVFLMLSSLSFGQQISFQKNTNIKASQLTQFITKDNDSLILISKQNKIKKVDIYNSVFSKAIPLDTTKVGIELKSLPFGEFVVQAKIDNKWIIMYLQKSDHNMRTSGNRDVMAIQTKKTRPSKYYWVVRESNSNLGSNKSMTLAYRHDVAKLISKNKHELKSKTGKGNNLVVYSVYDKSKFIDKQFRNPNYYKSVKKSEFFDTEPFYESKHHIQTNSTP